jgi:hypothetical protein
MHERYDYRTLRTERGAWPKVTDAAGAIEGLFGVWRGEIGWHTDEGALMSFGDADFSVVPGVLESTVQRLEATVRPVDPTPPDQDGIYAHRWFEVAPDDVDKFIELSVAAWPEFEDAYEGTRIIGLWRSVDAAEPARLLLITRYASLATWENSRPYTPGPAAAGAREKFLRRAELTRRTIVRITRLTRPST